jgi:hypothetical protein
LSNSQSLDLELYLTAGYSLPDFQFAFRNLCQEQGVPNPVEKFSSDQISDLASFISLKLDYCDLAQFFKELHLISRPSSIVAVSSSFNRIANDLGVNGARNDF